MSKRENDWSSNNFDRVWSPNNSRLGFFLLFAGRMWCNRMWTFKEFCSFRNCRKPQWQGTFCLSISSMVCSLNKPASSFVYPPKNVVGLKSTQNLILLYFRPKHAAFDFPYLLTLELKFDALFQSLPLNRYLARAPPPPPPRLASHWSWLL